MSGPLPPYLGSWSQLMHELLQNPFLGSPWPPIPHRLAAARARFVDESQALSSPGPWPWLPALIGSGPNPWREISMFLVSQISLKELASTLPPEQGALLTANVEQSLADEIDDICGTKPPGWHWPGPPPWVFQIASELSLIANTLQAGSLRNEVTKVASQILKEALAAPAVTGKKMAA